MTTLQVLAKIGRTLVYRSMPFRVTSVEPGYTDTSGAARGLLFHASTGRWRRMTVPCGSLEVRTCRSMGAARESFSWMEVNETIGRRLRRGDGVVREELDVVCLDDDIESDGVVVATRNNRSEVKVAWLVEPRHRRHR